MVPWKRRTCVQQSAEDFKEKTGGALEARETDIRWVSKRGNDLIQFGDEIFGGKSCGLKRVTLSFKTEGKQSLINVKSLEGSKR